MSEQRLPPPRSGRGTHRSRHRLVEGRRRRRGDGQPDPRRDRDCEVTRRAPQPPRGHDRRPARRRGRDGRGGYAHRPLRPGGRRGSRPCRSRHRGCRSVHPPPRPPRPAGPRTPRAPRSWATARSRRPRSVVRARRRTAVQRRRPRPPHPAARRPAAPPPSQPAAAVPPPDDFSPVAEEAPRAGSDGRPMAKPPVRKLAKERGVEPACSHPPTGVRGEVTRSDLLAHLESGGTAAAAGS